MIRAVLVAVTESTNYVMRRNCRIFFNKINPEGRFATSIDALQKGNSITSPVVASKDDVWGDPGRRRICQCGHFSHTSSSQSLPVPQPQPSGLC
jgi:hypothetical protein